MSGDNLWCSTCKSHHHPVEDCVTKPNRSALEYELFNTLMDVMNQACQVKYKNGTCYISHDFLSSYEGAVFLLEEHGYAKKVYKNKALWKLDWDKLNKDYNK